MRWNQEEEPVTLVAVTSGGVRRSDSGDDGDIWQIVHTIGFHSTGHGGARDHSHSNQVELRTSLEWSHGSPTAGKVAGREVCIFNFSISFSEALEADLGLAPVEKCVQNMIS